MPNFVIFDKTDPATAEALSACEVGVPETVNLTFTPLSVDETSVVATTDVPQYVETVEETVEEAAPVAAEAPYKPKAKAGSATAI